MCITCPLFIVPGIKISGRRKCLLYIAFKKYIQTTLIVSKEKKKSSFIRLSVTESNNCLKTSLKREIEGRTLSHYSHSYYINKNHYLRSYNFFSSHIICLSQGLNKIHFRTRAIDLHKVLRDNIFIFHVVHFHFERLFSVVCNSLICVSQSF